MKSSPSADRIAPVRSNRGRGPVRAGGHGRPLAASARMPDNDRLQPAGLLSSCIRRPVVDDDDGGDAWECHGRRHGRPDCSVSPNR